VTDLTFLPYLRRGLVRHVAAADPGSGGLDAAVVAMGITVAGEPIDADVGMLAPHRVASIAPGEILRRYPAPGAADVEPNYFPLIEFAAPDLPWRYTPATFRAQGKLRPWVVLVVVEADADGIEYTGTTGGTGVLRVEPDLIAQLPPAAETWGWAHVQSSRPFAEVAAAVEDEPSALLSRLVCPRLMDPGVRYRAALVNAFAPADDERSEPAWTASSSEPVDLVVYDTWTFTTSVEAGDFESLCELLLPATEVAELGVRAVDVTRPGLDVKWPKTPWVVDLVGALADPGVISDDPPPGTTEFSAVVEPILDDVLGRTADGGNPRDYDALRDDPIVGLPFYGSWPSRATGVPDGGWPRALNLRTTRRMAAGLGARTVRHNQEALMAAAWDQLGAVREVSDELNRGRLGAEVGRTWQARVAEVESGDRLNLAAPLLSFVQVHGEPARKLLADSLAPVATLDRVWVRRTPRARGASAATAFVRGTRLDASAIQREAFSYQTVAAPEGMQPIDGTLFVADESRSLLSATAVAYARTSGLAAQIGGVRLAGYVQGGSIRVRRSSSPFDPPLDLDLEPVPASADDVAVAVADLDPLLAMRASLVARIPALEELIPSGELPAQLLLAPEFRDALYWDLAELDPDVIVPGLGDFPENRVRLLAVNAGFVGAYLVAANHALACEFLWREFPADLTATYFPRFFDYVDPDQNDIDPIDGWAPGSSLASNLPNAEGSTAILIRGDLVRRYPEVNVFLAPMLGPKQADYAGAALPSFEGRLGEDVLVVGFPLDTDVVLGRAGGPEHFVVLEERVTAPRFGLDVDRDGDLTTWAELAVTDFPAAAEHVRTGPIPGEIGSPELGGVKWGRNAAHFAAAVHQSPFRRLFPATRLVGSS
jgi:hypothetical protein